MTLIFVSASSPILNVSASHYQVLSQLSNRPCIDWINSVNSMEHGNSIKVTIDDKKTDVMLQFQFEFNRKKMVSTLS